VEHQVNPVFLKMPTQSFLDSLTDLLLPFMTLWILIFFLIFECICNAFAEITCFADREFYADWWNSTNFEEFARLWNKPVHHFLLRHCYKESIVNLNFSKKDATFLTFLLSSLMHELVFVIVGKKIRFYLFFLQMFQLPLIMLGRMETFKKMPIAGNAFFWLGLCLGPPLLAVCYCRDHFVL
jgi:sterol O-acyltransferase